MIGALSTGAVAKIFDYRLGRLKHDFEKSVQDKSIEMEELSLLKKELQDRREEMIRLEEELDKWKGKYYEMLEHLINLKGQLDK